jgi:hypothetical protein
MRNFIAEFPAFRALRSMKIRISAMIESTKPGSEMLQSPEAAAIRVRTLYRYLPASSFLFLGRKDFLNTDLVNEVLAMQVNQMSSLLVVRQVRTNTVDHYHDESAIIHIVPIRTANELVFAVPDERTVKIG